MKTAFLNSGDRLAGFGVVQHVVDNDIEARVGERPRDAATNAASAAGHECDWRGYFHVVVSHRYIIQNIAVGRSGK
jgi:hypothetical protein